MRPLVLIAIAFVLGLFSSRHLKPGYEVIVPLILLSSIPLIVSSLMKRRLRPYIYLPLFFFIGGLFILPAVLQDVWQDIRPNDIKDFVRSRNPLRVEGVVDEVAEVSQNAMRVYVDVRRAFAQSGWQYAQGRVFLSVEESQPVNRGDIVMFMSNLKEPRNFNNPGEFDYEWWLNRKGVRLRGHVGKGFFVKVRDGSGFLNSIDRLRGHIRGFVDSSGARHGEIIKALAIGERGGIEEETTEAFKKSGTAHILAISGLHVGFVAYLSYLLFFWILRRSERFILSVNVKKLAWALSLLPVASYGIISGLSVSTRRAVVMVGVFVLMAFLGRLGDIYSAVALAALVVLAVEPGTLWDTSFQLSFVSVLTIIYLTPALSSWFGGADKTEKDWFKRGAGKIKTLFFVSVAASLGTYPILAYHFHRVSLVGFISNILIVPITGFVTVPLVLASLLAASLWKGLGFVLMGLADISLDVIVRLAGFFSGFPYSSLWVATPTVFEIAVFYAIILLAPFVRKKRTAFILLVFFESLFLLERGYLHYKEIRRELRVSFISVGQGDSALVLFPSEGLGRGKRMLIDGGGSLGWDFNAGEGIIAPFLWKKRIKKVDYVVLTHPQRDHMEGLGFIARNFSPEEFWWSGAGEISPELEKVLDEKGIRIVTFNGTHPGMVVGGVRVDFLNPPLNPPLNLRGNAALDVNNSSLVLRLVYGERRFLFTGDIKEEAEGLLLKRDISADVLKVPHHGSRFSSSPSFIEKVNPSFAVVSSGWMNPFGFPHKETLKRYEDRGIAVYRTDRDGAVEVSTDGRGISVETYLRRD